MAPASSELTRIRTTLSFDNRIAVCRYYELFHIGRKGTSGSVASYPNASGRAPAYHGPMDPIAPADSPDPIYAVPVDVAAFVDTFAQGPYHEPVPVNSWQEFQMFFGGFEATSEASYAVYLYFENGGEFAWVVRVPDPIESGPALMSASGERQASPGALADSLIGSTDARTGMHALRGLERKRPGTLAIPRAAELGAHGARVYTEALSLAAELGMFLLIDPPLLADTPEELLQWLRANPGLRDGNAALYYPRLYFPDALQHGRNRSFAPSGAVAGLLSWLDQERGVWQAPAGLHAALEAVTLTRELSAEEFGPLTHEGVNAIREFPGHGAVLWGARTLAGGSTSDPKWKYVPMRRLLLLLERSLSQGIRWTAFEPNGESLWMKVRAAAETFLVDLWRKGAMQGATATEAFFVHCGPTTMTQDDLDNGRLVLQVGIAVVKPAEFAILRITSWTSEARLNPA
ncbi:MAG: phage tail sheath family protein [Bryobacterales bacterium]|nr:phage tail sheath family protein [Bryobacterales bacterium]